MTSVTLGLAALLVSLGARPSFAHFQELRPSSQILEGETQQNVTITALFTHPMAGSPTMNMGQPPTFGVISRDGKRKDLLSTLKPVTISGKQAYTANDHVPGPANYVFFYRSGSVLGTRGSQDARSLHQGDGERLRRG
jgi:uncharacterized GH25 family protein